MPWGDCTGPFWAQNRKGRGNGWRGRGHGFGWRRGPMWDNGQVPFYDKETEKNFLKTQETWLKQALDNIRARLNSLNKDKE